VNFCKTQQKLWVRITIHLKSSSRFGRGI